MKIRPGKLSTIRRENTAFLRFPSRMIYVVLPYTRCSGPRGVEICWEIVGSVPPQDYSRPWGGARECVAQRVYHADSQERRPSVLRQEKSQLDVACIRQAALVPGSTPRHHHYHQVYPKCSCQSIGFHHLICRRVEGNVFKLREDLSEFLLHRYEQEFISQANEIMQKVVFRGNFDSDFKEFLREKGF